MPTFPIFLLLCATLISTSVLAAGRDAERRDRMPESVQRVENETGGRVLQVRPVQRGDREVYRMKVLTPEGRVKVMQDDPRRRARAPVPPPAPARARERDDDR
jgi:hypothetical protein